MASMAVSLVARGIYHETSPAMQTRAQINPTLMMSWWATIFSLLIIIVRLCGRYIRVERFFAEDKVMMISVIPLVIRMVLVHFVLILGTNNTTTTGLTEQEISNRELGSKLVLAARIFYAIFIWTAKVTVCEFLKRVTGLSWRRSTTFFLRFISYFLFSTLVAVVIATLAECQPFHHYWQVIPDPGPTCRTGYVNLITMGTCDVITDLLLVAIPIPIILMAQMPLKRRLTLSTLFCLSLILVGITSYRVPSVIEHQGSQPYRSLLASLEILAATAVSNVLVIGSFVRDRGIKKLKYKRAQGSASVSESMDKSFIRRNTVMQHQWGSDSELATGLCIRLDPDMYTIPDPDETRLPRPAPTAPPAHIPLAVARTGTLDPTWSFATTRHSDDDRISATESLERKVSPHEYLRTSQSPREISPSSQTRRVSLSDVGGLLTRALPESASDHVRAQTCLSSPVEGVQRRLGAGSRAFLEDVGIFGPRAAANRPRPPDSGPAELPFPPAAFGNRLISMSGSSDATLHADVELHDVGGLLARRDH
ncbi:hypothetical protein E8E15_006685 [Penicillium rubens]|uniref:uncharacterized protein n=1 Tax=Penicillium rubens TaxID=1108849 RepID=UPI001D6353C8|nr:uncharacterized protein N7525_010497 [Penicillium rubens]KAF3021278.1 hypothetical protein E8E15_006685 [Penicillium rubens]KAJ5036184.1 hypothetical protein NUH16_004052 [Penicillium rubens]KAJ5821213.1 hypothetical protein N7525_010497 [Penicillium rubens]KAJ5858863.1 hypothetical protein N7534_004140 [Penicillium rubens]